MIPAQLSVYHLWICEDLWLLVLHQSTNRRRPGGRAQRFPRLPVWLTFSLLQRSARHCITDAPASPPETVEKSGREERRRENTGARRNADYLKCLALVLPLSLLERWKLERWKKPAEGRGKEGFLKKGGFVGKRCPTPLFSVCLGFTSHLSLPGLWIMG